MALAGLCLVGILVHAGLAEDADSSLGTMGISGMNLHSLYTCTRKEQ